MINLRYFFELEDEGNAYFYNPETVSFDHKAFDGSIDAIKKFLLGEDENTEIHVYCQNTLNEITAEAEIVRCIMLDVRNENSFTYKLLETMFEASDKIEKKVALLRYLLEKYFLAAIPFNVRANSDGYRMYVYDLPAGRNFKYLLPDAVAEKYFEYDDYVDVSKLTREEIASYVMPFYYRELGWFDNASIRNDPERMKLWSEGWFK